MTTKEDDLRPFARLLDKNGDLDMAFVDSLNFRLIQLIEHDIGMLEAPAGANLYADFREKLDLLEKVLKVRRLMHLPRQRRTKHKKRKR